MTPARLSRPRSGSAVAFVLGLVVVLAGLLAAGAATERSERGRGGGADAVTAGVPAPERPAAIARVAYAGPHRLTGPTVVAARVRGGAQRIVAVTFLLDGRPIGTDTTIPYRMDVDAAELPAGAHTLAAVAVDRLGRRSGSPVARVRVLPRAREILRASPGRGLSRALAALARGHVTVALAPGRYSVPPLASAAARACAGPGRAPCSHPRGAGGRCSAWTAAGCASATSRSTGSGGSAALSPSRAALATSVWRASSCRG